MRYEFHPEALAKYEEAARYYAGCHEGLELRFMASVEAAVRQVADAPDRWRIVEQDVRRCLTKVFPYAILYTLESDHVLIIAVTHCHREPGYWWKRLQGSAEPSAAPNGGPATQLGNSGVAEGPPSVSWTFGQKVSQAPPIRVGSLNDGETVLRLADCRGHGRRHALGGLSGAC